ncbi:(Fe-S)-binding protein [Desulfobotulus sp. H1]|uniref:(Fe-S)-binding protein n=1 Tax=Desulfobotulus pelophilus TaxID=2823377 RepID=A0ABT3N8W1_9BACT|nr:(Fe-S)-binding protein [Desulfobotulus pelophilus]MCW7753631.1 (Fe-S)-binding protein [Desulfobotulus pelophilus]
MTQQAIQATKNIVDEGIEAGLARLTPERIESVIIRVLNREAGARLRTYARTCVHCGLCSDACHHFLSMNRDPKLSPAGKVKRTIGVMMQKKGKVSADFIREAAMVAYSECNLCKKCVLYCPFGIDVGYLMTLVRRICHLLGVVPRYMQDTAHSQSVHFNQMWINGDEWVDTLFWQEEEARDEAPDIRIPVDKEGADIFYSVIGPEPKFRAQLIYQAAMIFEAAGSDWTMPGSPGWDNSDLCMFSGDNEMMGRIKRAHFEAAARLRVKKIVMGECGHAFRSVYDVGNRWLGFKMPPIPVIHAVEFYHDLVCNGKIRITKKFSQPVTLHDPCNIARGMGLYEKARELAHALCDTVVEMTPNREHNICCNAGGGIINCGPPFKDKRVESNSVKARQLFDAKALGAEVIIAPCHNCHGGLEDIIHHYGVEMDLKFFGDIIYEVMEKPE